MVSYRSNIQQLDDELDGIVKYYSSVVLNREDKNMRVLKWFCYNASVFQTD